MDFNEYMNTLMEQINNKRAKKLVEKEIRNHIEEQTETYEAEGLNHMDAENEAVKQMGNPVETGINLNRIHRPKMPYSLLAIAFVLTIIGVLMQAVIFRQSYANHTDDIFNSFLGNTIIYNMIGFIVIIVILNLDYSFITAHSIALYVLYLITIIWIAIYFRGYLDNFMAPYYATIIFPVILAGLIFRFRNQKTAGLVKCMLLSIFAIGLVVFVFSPNVFELNIHGLNMDRLDNDGFMETFIVIVCVLTLAIHKSVFAGNKKIQFAVLWTTITVSGIITAFILYIRHSKILIRMLIGIVPEKYSENTSFQMFNNINARNSTTMFSTLGNSSLPNRWSSDVFSKYVLNSIFSYFGIVLGTAVIAALLFFVFKAIAISNSQSNRAGFLIGMTCSISVLLRIIVYIGINFGYSLWDITSIPFLSFGFVNTMINAVFIGLILSVYRNTNILGEQNTVYNKRLKIVK